MKPGKIVKRPGRFKFLTGFCSNGQCEGTKHRSSMTGVALPTCKSWQTCPCECHQIIDQIFELRGMERHLIEGDYVPDYGDFAPLSVIYADAARLSMADDTTSHPSLERPIAANVRLVNGHQFAPTPTGRKGRGELEYMVLDVCDRWAKGELAEEHLTPKYVSELIAVESHKPTPSTGAIVAVWKRWEELGFCEMGSKPIRVLSFPSGTDVSTLDSQKVEARRKKKQIKAQVKRGFR